MSRKSHKIRTVRVLSHLQAPDFPGTTYVPTDIAELLVSRMVCERLSRKVIRMFEPASVFSALKAPNSLLQPYIPEIMPSSEVPGVFFQDPVRTSNMPRVNHFPRFRQAFALKGEEWRTRDESQLETGV